MSYTIVGFGAVGQALARAFARNNIEVAVTSRRAPEALAPQARAIGPTVVPKALQDAINVLARLQGHGLNATSVQNPLTTLEESVESAKRVLDRQDGPTVLVGHSFGGMLVSEAGVHRQRRPSRSDEIQVDVGLSTHPNNWKNRENWRCPSLC
ncbi:alpha/beta fold hydrolase [Rhizobium gallicum]|uniref:alpha/beta fold hydrolase n=1 Tax=Rhizobium gallicum TaxID=56730 RepID=UPI003B8A8522